MKQAIIDFSNCKYLADVHQRIKDALEFPSGYGGNWSAFEDYLRFECSVNQIIVKGISTVNKELLPHLFTMQEIMERQKQHVLQTENDIPFDYIIEEEETDA